MSQRLDLGNIAGNKWYTGLTLDHTEGAERTATGIAYANAHDMFLNTRTGAIYECVEGGADGIAAWVYRCNLITDIAFSVHVVNVVEEGNSHAVTSGGVWSKLNELGLLDGLRTPGPPGNPSTSVLTYSLGSPVAPEGGTDVSDWVDDSQAESNNWTLQPAAGQEWHIDNGGSTGRGMTLRLEDGMDVGSRICVYFFPGGSTEVCADVNISANIARIIGESQPETIAGVLLECTMTPAGWAVKRHYQIVPVPVPQYTAKIIYSFKNHAATSQYSDKEHTFTWSDIDASQATQTLKGFSTLDVPSPYGKTFLGWATSSTSTSKVYDDRASVTLAANQTLRLYPLYGEKEVVFTELTNDGAMIDNGYGLLVGNPQNVGDHVEYGRISSNLKAGSGDKNYTETFAFKPNNYISGFKDATYKLKIYGQVHAGNSSPIRISYRIGDDSEWVTLASSGTSGVTDTRIHDVEVRGSGLRNIHFKVYHHGDGSKSVSGSYKYGILSMTV